MLLLELWLALLCVQRFLAGSDNVQRERGGSNNLNTYLLDYDALEVVWIVIPLTILLLIGVPSLILLYLVEEKLNWLFSVKVRGHQWY